MFYGNICVCKEEECDMINPMSLLGKHVVITGASSGIGRAACVQASKLGAMVSLVARNEEKLLKTKSLMEGDYHKLYSFDLQNTDGIEELIVSITKDSCSIDGIVHCAGVALTRPIRLTKPELVEQMTRLHYYAFVELIRASVAKKRMNEGGSIIGISSTAATHGDKAQGMYAAAKGAMNAVVPPFAKELAPRKIRVNTIAFGMVDTDMYQGFLDDGGSNESLLQNQYMGVIPVEYAGNAICFMLSDASKYITGGTFNYDAGLLH